MRTVTWIIIGAAAVGIAIVAIGLGVAIAAGDVNP